MWRQADASGNVRWPVAIDGRTNILSTEEMSSYLEMHEGREEWKTFIQDYNPGTIVWPESEPLTERLRGDKDWAEIAAAAFKDEEMSVFVQSSWLKTSDSSDTVQFSLLPE